MYLNWYLFGDRCLLYRTFTDNKKIIANKQCQTETNNRKGTKEKNASKLKQTMKQNNLS
jgi:hypothetical protein